MSERLEVPTSDGPMPAHLWRPEAGSGPGILLLQEIFGISPYIRRRAEDLAALGYVVLAPEVFWRLGVSDVANGPDMLEEAMGLLNRLDWDAAVADSTAALESLRDRPEVRGGTGVVGFCFGGGLGYAVVAGDPADALVSYYGSALPGLVEAVPSVSTPSLHVFGESDAYLPMDQVTRIRDAVTSGDAPAEVNTYPGADHAFDNDDFVNHDPAASAAAWSRTEAWLAEVLPTGVDA
ncbi:dienelactone hydrolase family protein [Phycicoccus sonneratiae]|uniref:Dienelactone hydrolase family protein n=1 Tax=Phycicoccus sonneratiae TaxID=2807628 RepID=A0ABS2CMS7_9MICO|nr:dienelactone hydrolase family protein [Phycicoccus sonneraticus]MBM6401178.1 dienelactone hydrolase family protein [Phycicoccus sonneraticus]